MSTDPFTPVLAAIGRGDLTGAAGLLERLLADLPSDAPAGLRARAHRLAATSWRLAGNAQEARAHLEAARAMAPTDLGPTTAAELDQEARAQTELDAGFEAAPATAGEEPVPLSSDPAAAAQILDHLAARLAELSGDRPPQVQAFLAAVEALGEGRTEEALARLADASDRSRAARDEVTYVVTTLTWGELLEREGNRLGSYGVLARAMATLRRGVGAEAARDSLATLEQAMRDRRDRWGAEAFAEVALEFRRRLTPPGTPAGEAP